MQGRAAIVGWLLASAVAIAACAPQSQVPRPIQLTENDRVTPSTRAQIDAANAQLEFLRTFLGHYVALPPP